MRYNNGAFLSIPFINTVEDGSTERCWAHMDFTGSVDHRRIKRQIRKWVKSNLGRHLGREEQAMLMKRIKSKDADGTWRS